MRNDKPYSDGLVNRERTAPPPDRTPARRAGAFQIEQAPFSGRARRVGVPSPLLCIVVLTALSVAFGWADAGLLRAVGDMGTLPDAFPGFLFPDVPWN